MSERVFRSIDGVHLATSCFTQHRLTVSPAPRTLPSTWSIEFSEPARLRGQGLLRGSRLAIEMDVRQRRDADTTEVARYAYTLFDRTGRELLAFHWHPDGRSPIAFPHLHVSAALRGTTPSGQPAILPLDKVHGPTGLMTPVDIAILLVGELGISPMLGDWRQRLTQAAAMLPAFPS